ncbi:Gfo/Idh/MocA family oxidoreductase [Leadbetterella byssophila]|uniref:Gfo/Idh/MocA family oxidoreductase n=1 Tax=Leadbetterella byssophila TaxID=316068 RepID=UPI00399F8450
MIRVGLVGFGLSGRHLQAPFFLTHPDFELRSIVTSQELPLPRFQGVQRLSQWEDLLSDPEIDLVSICSPSSTHKEYAIKALQAGKHVLVEKPVAANPTDVEEMFDTARKCGKVLSVFHNRRFDSDFLTVKRVIESGILGEILSYEAHFDRYKPELNPKAWKEAPDPTNGILYDLGAHLVDQAITLFGLPERFSGSVYTQRENSSVDDAFHLNLQMGKVQVFLRSSLLVKDQGPKYIIHGSKGSFTKYGMDVQEDHLVKGMLPVDSEFGFEPKDNRAYLRTQIHGLEMEGRIDTERGSWYHFFSALAASINGQSEPLIKFEQMHKQLEILNAVKNV